MYETVCSTRIFETQTSFTLCLQPRETIYMHTQTAKKKTNLSLGEMHITIMTLRTECVDSHLGRIVHHSDQKPFITVLHTTF